MAKKKKTEWIESNDCYTYYEDNEPKVIILYSYNRKEEHHYFKIIDKSPPEHIDVDIYVYEVDICDFALFGDYKRRNTVSQTIIHHNISYKYNPELQMIQEFALAYMAHLIDMKTMKKKT